MKIPTRLNGAVIFPLFKKCKMPNWNFQISEETSRPENWVGEAKDPERLKHCGWSKWTAGLNADYFTPYMKSLMLTGYGIDTGRSGLLVVDLDMKSKDQDGIAAWKSLCAEHGWSDETFTVESATGGGQHLYFAVEGDDVFKNSTGKLANGIDVRAKGGFIVGPETQTEHGSYKVIKDTDILPVPEWLKKEIREKESVFKDVELFPRENYTQLSDDFPFPWSEKSLHEASLTVAAAIKGTVRNTIFSQALRCGHAGIPEHLVESSFINALDSIHHNRTTKSAIRDGWLIGKTKMEEDLISGKLTLRPEKYASPSSIPETHRASRKGDSSYLKIHSQTLCDQSKLEENRLLPEAEKQQLAFEWLDRKNWILDVLSEDEIATYIANKILGKWCYIEEWREWAFYNANTGHWEREEFSIGNYAVKRSTPTEMVRGFTKQLSEEAKSFTDTAIRTAGRGLTSSKFQKPLLEKLQSFAGIRMNAAEFDCDPVLMLTANCVLNPETGEQLPFQKDYFFSNRTKTAYKPGAKHEAWDEILKSIPDDSVEWMKTVLGRSLSGKRSAKDFTLLMAGVGSNGKSTLLDSILNALDGYAHSSSDSILRGSSGSGEDWNRIKLRGKRFVIIEEMNSGILDTSKLKDLVGSVKIQGCEKFKMPEVFPNLFSLFLTANEHPRLSGSDTGSTRRLRALNFCYEFKTEQEGLVLPTDRLVSPLISDDTVNSPEFLEAVLAWLVEGCISWKQADRYMPANTSSVERDTEKWTGRSDKIGAFIEDTFVFDENFYILTEDARDAYTNYCLDNGYGKQGRENFLHQLESHRFFRGHQSSEICRDNRTGDRTHSQFIDPKKVGQKVFRDSLTGEFIDTYKPLEAKARCAHIRGVRFRTAADDEIRDMSEEARPAYGSFEATTDLDDLGMDHFINPTTVDVYDFGEEDF